MKVRGEKKRVRNLLAYYLPICVVLGLKIQYFVRELIVKKYGLQDLCCKLILVLFFCTLCSWKSCDLD